MTPRLAMENGSTSAVRTTKDRLTAALRAMRQKTDAATRLLTTGQSAAELRQAECALATADLVLGALPGEMCSVIATMKQTGLRLDQVRIHDVICHGHVLLSNVHRAIEETL